MNDSERPVIRALRLLRLGACILYWCVLTFLLLTPNPLGWIGLSRLPGPLASGLGVHFLLFSALAVLAFAAQWPRRAGRTLLIALLAYALASETLQWFVPRRVVEWSDYLENFLGVAAGWLLYTLAQRLVALPRTGRWPNPG